MILQQLAMFVLCCGYDCSAVPQWMFSLLRISFCGAAMIVQFCCCDSPALWLLLLRLVSSRAVMILQVFALLPWLLHMCHNCLAFAINVLLAAVIVCHAAMIVLCYVCSACCHDCPASLPWLFSYDWSALLPRLLMFAVMIVQHAAMIVQLCCYDSFVCCHDCSTLLPWLFYMLPCLFDLFALTVFCSFGTIFI